MNRTIAVCTLVCSISIATILTACKPDILGDSNDFLKGFVPHEYLSFMGVIVTISLASAANVVLELNKYEEKFNSASFSQTRDSLRASAFWLLATLPIALAEAVVKPIGPVTNVHWQSALNGAALITIIFSFLILADIAGASFDLQPPTGD